MLLSQFFSDLVDPAPFENLSVDLLPDFVAHLRSVSRQASSPDQQLLQHLCSLELAVALGFQFPNAANWILWEVDEEHTRPLRRQSSVESPHQTIDTNRKPGVAFSPVKRGSGLHTARGLVESRELQGESHWIIVVMSRDEFWKGLDHYSLQELRDTANFLMIVHHECPLGVDPQSMSGLKHGHDVLELCESLTNVQTGSAGAVLNISIDSLADLTSTAEAELSGSAIPSPCVQQLRNAFQHQHQVVIQDGTALVNHLSGDGTFVEAERAFLHSSIALAAGGCFPIVFLEEAVFLRHQQFITDSCTETDLPIVWVVQETKSIWGQRSGSPLTPRALEYLLLTRQTPVLIPTSQAELTDILQATVARQTPALIPIPAEGLSDESAAYPVRWSEPEPLRDGTDVVILAAGAQVRQAMSLADALSTEALTTRVINLRFLHPLNPRTLQRLVSGFVDVYVLESPSHRQSVLQQLREALPQTVLRVISLPESHSEAEPLALEIQHRWRNRQAQQQTAEITYLPVDPSKTQLYERLGFSTEMIERERQEIAGQKVTPTTARWIARYEQIGQRSPFLWQWCLHGLKLTTLPCVDANQYEALIETKLLSIIFCVILDDVADQLGDETLLKLLLSVPQSSTRPRGRQLTRQQSLCLEVAWEIWEELEDRLRACPQYAPLETLLQFDFEQLCTSLKYSALLNSHPALLNLVEHDSYVPHNIMMMVFATMDLMCSTDPPIETGLLREAVWHSQLMGRIGNLLSTWQRELRDRDFTSAVFARSVLQGDLTLHDLLNVDVKSLESLIRAGEQERYFYERWQWHQRQFEDCVKGIASVDFTCLFPRHERFFAIHLACHGLI